MIIFEAVGIALVHAETWARGLGAKTIYGCAPYSYFLLGFCQPLITVVILVICYVVSASAANNPANVPCWMSYYVYTYDGLGASDYAYFSALYATYCDLYGDLDDKVGLEPSVAIVKTLSVQSYGLAQASLAFMIVSWIAVAGLIVVNILSKLGVRPQCGNKVAAETTAQP
jgi:hypothetical protein